jgi:Protein of unknown function (DUF3011)
MPTVPARAALWLLLGVALCFSRPARADHEIVCESLDDRYRQCEIDTRGGVRLEQQLSRAACRYNDTWGYDRRGVWVSRGCRGRFTVADSGWQDSSSGGWSDAVGPTIACESDDGDRDYCRADTSAGVRMSRQLSRSPCIFGATWGYDRRGIWVDDGCRAEFELSRGGWNPNSPQRQERGTITCESIEDRRSYCRADTRDGVRLEQQLSRSECDLGSTWGYDSGGIWVRDGCRARFSLRGGFGGGGHHGERYEADDDDDLPVGLLLLGALAAIAADSDDETAEYASTACQREIARQIEEDHGRIQGIEFEHLDADEDGSYENVYGDGRVDLDGDSERFQFECRVRTPSNTVVSADYDF